METIGNILVIVVLVVVIVGFSQPMWSKWFKKPKQNSTGPGETNGGDGTEIPTVPGDEDNKVKEVIE